MCVIHGKFKVIQANFANKQNLPTLKPNSGEDGNQLLCIWNLAFNTFELFPKLKFWIKISENKLGMFGGKP